MDGNGKVWMIILILILISIGLIVLNVWKSYKQRRRQTRMQLIAALEEVEQRNEKQA